MQQEPRRWNHEHRQKGGCDHAADHGRGDPLHDFRTGTLPQHDWKQPTQNYGDGHGFGADPQHGSFANRVHQKRFGQRFTRLEARA